MATQVITLSDLTTPGAALLHPAIQEIQGRPPRSVSLRASNDERIVNTLLNNATATSTTTNANSIDDQTSRLPFGRLMLVYACLATAYFTSTLDINAVASALPVIGSSLNAGTSITWAGTAYLMGQAACQPLYGRLSDVFGRKPVLMMSLLFIIFGGILCGFAQTPTWLYVCRALSGVGGGGVSSVVQIVVSDLVSMRDRGKYQGLLSVAIGLGSCTGPFIAAEVSRRGGEAWRWIFWVPPSWREKLRKIDWFGLVVIVTAMVFLLVSRESESLKMVEPGTTDNAHSFPSTPADQCGLGTAPW
jgi:MFS family permease